MVSGDEHDMTYHRDGGRVEMDLSIDGFGRIRWVVMC
jgi:hypothetical protein